MMNLMQLLAVGKSIFGKTKKDTESNMSEFNLQSHFSSSFAISPSVLEWTAIHNREIKFLPLETVWAYLKRVQKPRVILYLLLTSQPYFLAVSTGNLFWGQTGLWHQASVGHLKSLPLFWYWDKDLDRLFLFRCFVWFLFLVRWCLR